MKTINNYYSIRRIVRIGLLSLFFLHLIRIPVRVSAQSIAERQLIESPETPQSYNSIGSNIALNGEKLVLGDFTNAFDLNGGNQMQGAGAVYSYALDSDTLWRYNQKILSNDRFNAELFGSSIDVSGSILAVGAYRSTLDTNQTNFLVDAGAVYIYELDSSGTWKWNQKLIPSIRNMDDEFGRPVSLKGNTLAVGSFLHDYDKDSNYLPGAGSVFIFNRDSSGKFKEIQHLTASDRHVNMVFGREVILLSENELFVGAALEGQNAEGAVYYFVKNSFGEWEEKQKIMASSREIGADFGDTKSIAVTNSLLVVGAHNDQLDNLGQSYKWNCGAVYVFKRSMNGLWQQSARITAPFREWDMRFGSSVTLNNEVLVVGAPFASTDENNQDSIVHAGASYVYLKNGVGDFEFFQKLVNGKRKKIEYFGGEIDLSDNNLIVGSSGSGGTYIGFCIFYTFMDSAVGFTEFNARYNRFDAVIYPNPNSGNFIVNSQQNQLDQLLIYDVNGRLVYQENLLGSKNAEVQLPDNILNGLYLVRIESSGEVVVNKKLLVNGR